MSDYTCANCGERSSMMGHWRINGFTCEKKPKDEPATTEISEAAKAKAIELLCGAGWTVSATVLERCASYIQQVSDAAKGVSVGIGRGETGPFGIEKHQKNLAPFILPEPLDPFIEVMREAGHDCRPENILRILAKRGLKIVEDKS